MGGIMASFIRFLWFADYHYHLTEKGIYYTCQQVISENAYTVVRITAWVGIAVCVLAAALIGPLAFVGAGAFALMSFSMTNFSAETISIGIRFDGCYRIVHLKDQEVIRLYNDTRKRYSTGGIFCSPDEKFHLIQLLKSQLPDVKILEAKRYKEVLNPSMISPDETSAS
ncbi:hypothetical protein Vspart_00031 [Vibrio spartinae]|uniref:Uncharacterized protein n=2 Tax=Vibrio spartinae TaxID=1918945 RepID=A0ABX6QU57_9VIBR|nr:hypothetical protein Vspart_00031 [Vibrio spartinae]